MTSTVKYSKVPMADQEDTELTTVFDYSSPFSYEDGSSYQWKYRSAFTYENASLQLERGNNKGSQLSNDIMARLIVLVGFYVIYIVTFPVMIWFSFIKIKENERCVVFRLGKCQGSKGPGFVFVLPLLDRYHKIDIHLKAFSVPPKQVITNDGAIIEVGAEICYQIQDAERSVTNVQDLNQSTRILVQSALCNILSQKTLAEIEAERRSISDIIMENSNETCLSWGVEIQRAELSQIKVLSDPPPKPAPTLMMPPGLMSSAGFDNSSGLPSAFMQLANALIKNQGQEQSINEALMAFKNAQAETNVGNEAEKLNDKPEVTDYRGMKASMSKISPIGADRLLTMIAKSLDESLVQKVGATYQFDIQGAEGGFFYLDLLHGCGSIARGTLPSGEPDVLISTTMEDLQTMLSGDLSPFHAYMSGRLKVSGDVRVALRLEELSDKLKPELNQR